jgi:hypothetical protein
MPFKSTKKSNLVNRIAELEDKAREMRDLIKELESYKRQKTQEEVDLHYKNVEEEAERVGNEPFASSFLHSAPGAYRSPKPYQVKLPRGDLSAQPTTPNNPSDDTAHSSTFLPGNMADPTVLPTPVAAQIENLITFEEDSPEQSFCTTTSEYHDAESYCESLGEKKHTECVYNPSPPRGAPPEPKAMTEVGVKSPADDCTRNILTKVHVGALASPSCIAHSSLNELAPLGVETPMSNVDTLPPPSFFKNTLAVKAAFLPPSTEIDIHHTKYDERIQDLELRLGSEKSASRARITQLETDVLQRNMEIRRLRLEVLELRSHLGLPKPEDNCGRRTYLGEGLEL